MISVFGNEVFASGFIHGNPNFRHACARRAAIILDGIDGWASFVLNRRNASPALLS
jgi:hypothetical protein